MDTGKTKIKEAKKEPHRLYFIAALHTRNFMMLNLNLLISATIAVAALLAFTSPTNAADLQSFDIATQAAPYHIEIRERTEGDQRLLVQRSGKNVLDQTAHNFALVDLTSKEPNLGFSGANLPIFDLDGNGTKDLIVRIWNGGAHCCYTYDIYSLSNKITRIWHFEAGDGHILTTPANQPGLPILLIEDSTYRYWGPGVPVMPVVALRWQGDKFRPDLDRMKSGKDRHQLPTTDEVKRLLKSHSTSALTEYMLNQYYTGHAKEANAFLESAWAASADVKKIGSAAAFKRDFLKQMVSSPFFDAIETINNGQVDFLEAKQDAAADKNTSKSTKHK